MLNVLAIFVITSSHHNLKSRLLLALAVSWVSVVDVHAQADQDLIDEIREALKVALDQDSLGAGYAAMINFAVAPDISTASYTVENEDGGNPELNVSRVPFRINFPAGSSGMQPFIQANLTYQTLDSRFDFVPGEHVNSRHKAYGGSISFGAELPIGDHLTLLPVVDTGLVRLKNSAGYHGEFSSQILEPALSGLVFDWKANAWLVGVSLGFDYGRNFERNDLKVHGSVTHYHVESYDSTSEAIEFSNEMTTFNLQLENAWNTGKNLAGYPVGLVTHAGATQFLGNNRDVLGFDRFFDVGIALETDLSSKNWKVNRLRLGAKLIFGEDVDGWGLMLGYRF